MSIVLATCAIAQEYGQAHALDDRLLLSALHQRGIEGRVAVWNDASFDWDRAEQVIIRSTWDYHLHGEQFLAWAEQVASLCPLWNPWHVVRWNADKRYLRQLAACGIAAIPTHWVAQGETAHLAQIMYEHDWQRVMLKPAMGLNAYGILEVDLRHLVEGQDHLDAHLRQHGMLVQQFFPSVTHLGERSLVWIAGIWSTFALRKRSLTRSNPLTSGDEELIEASSSELQFAQRMLSVTGELLGLTAEDLLFARVDVVPDEQGRLWLMELELIEPRLYFDQLPHLADRLADALVRRPRNASRASSYCGAVSSSLEAIRASSPGYSVPTWRGRSCTV